MSSEDETRCQSSNKYWICNKLFIAEDSEVRDHDHATGKYIEIPLIGVVILILNWLKRFL